MKIPFVPSVVEGREAGAMLWGTDLDGARHGRSSLGEYE
jgi:hypothetical protein